MSNRNKIVLLIVWILILLPFLISAFSPSEITTPNVFLKITQLDWDTFYFEPRIDFLDLEDVNFRWEFSDGYFFEGSSLIRTLETGDYNVKLTAVDFYGRNYTQAATLSVHYLALTNKWFWGFFYLFILLLIVYYWFAKLIYMVNEKEINKQVDAFIEGLDDADFWKNLAKAIKSKRS